MKKHCKSTETEVTRWPNVFYLSSSSSSDGLVQNHVTLSPWFSCKTAAFYTEQCTSLSFFPKLWSLIRQFKLVHWRTIWLHLQHHVFTCMYAHKSLSNVITQMLHTQYWRIQISSNCHSFARGYIPMDGTHYALSEEGVNSAHVCGLDSYIIGYPPSTPQQPWFAAT